MHERAGREFAAQPLEQGVGENALLRRRGGEVPLRAVRVIDRHEGRLAAHRQAHVVLHEVGVDGVAEFFDLRPLLLGVGLGDAWRFVNTLHAHLEAELALAIVHAAADGRGARRVGRAGQRDVAFAREQTGSRVESDPSAAGQIDFAPRVQIGEIFFRAARPVERLHVGLELNQVAADEARGETAVPE